MSWTIVYDLKNGEKEQFLLHTIEEVQRERMHAEREKHQRDGQVIDYRIVSVPQGYRRKR